ncbi:hypothetical protein [Parasitella parasitica]|uniref:Uncharacterized protein n=1 Tax=Parasitella parasitica TaxID=35722 RepID=A0A0B7NRH0_9FUNG|nr:hypothetical protein [Parasitella parasitica]
MLLPFLTQISNRLLGLNQEYEKLSRKRQDQCNSLVDQWQTYQQEQKDSRQAEISKRETEFDAQLDELDRERRQGWVSQKQDESVICKKLLAYLQQYTADNDILTFPTDILDLFWSIDVQVPVLETELPSTIGKLSDMLKKNEL